PSAPVKGQTEQILRKIDGILAHYGSHKSKLLSATVYLANMGSYDDMNAAWDAWVEKGQAPARATVETKLARPQYLVEIAAVAAACRGDREASGPSGKSWRGTGPGGCRCR